MNESQSTHRELHDDLVENRATRIFGRYLDLPCALQTVIGCGVATVLFVLGAIAWGIIVALIF